MSRPLPSLDEGRALPSREQALRVRLARSQRLLALSLGGCLALAGALLFATRRGGFGVTRAAFDDPELRAEAVRQMMQLGDGYFDAHPDPDVARLLLPSMPDEEFYGGLHIATNALGLREREYELPKPAGTVRIALLGDSFVFGSGLNAEERFGSALERELRARSPRDGAIEVLHLGLPSWNVRSESAFLRRQLSDLRPDLVVHLLVNNDLDDCNGVRGFGGMAEFSPQQRERANGSLMRRYPKQELGVPYSNWLSHGIDGESRGRFAAAAADIRRLRDAVVESGGRYQLMFAWGRLLSVAGAELAPAVPADERIFVDPSFGEREEHRVAPDDGHWSAIGSQRIAELLYGLIRERDLLPALELPAWPAAEEAVARIHEAGTITAAQPLDLQRWLDDQPIASAIDFAAPSPTELAQIHGGLNERGFAAPYASLILARPSGSTLVVRGRPLARAELVGTVVTAHLDGIEVGSTTLADGRSFEIFGELPAELAGRSYVTVSFTASDWANLGPDQRECRAFKLDRVAFEAR